MVSTHPHCHASLDAITVSAVLVGIDGHGTSSDVHDGSGEAVQNFLKSNNTFVSQAEGVFGLVTLVLSHQLIYIKGGGERFG